MSFIEGDMIVYVENMALPVLKLIRGLSSVPRWKIRIHKSPDPEKKHLIMLHYYTMGKTPLRVFCFVLFLIFCVPHSERKGLFN